MPDSRWAALARIAVDHPGQLVAVAGGLGYLLGYVNLRAMAAGLGVGPDDLELVTTDYVVSAAFWVLVLTPVLAGSLWITGASRRLGWRSLTGVSTMLLAFGLAVVSVVQAATVVSPTWGFLMLLVVFAAAGMGWWLEGAGLAVLLALIVSSFGTFVPISYESGEQIRSSPELGADTPAWLKLVLAFDEGLAQFPTGAECALRISDRVYVTNDDVRIEPSPIAFRSRSCFPVSETSRRLTSYV